MGNLRDIKRKARRDLHRVMGIAALYLSAADDVGTPITVRLHSKTDALAMKGENGMAARRELEPKLLFMRSELADAGITLKRKDIVSIEPGEAYLLESDDPVDDITVTWYVTVLSAEKAEGLPVPEATDG